ncbi:MAG TPA: CotH kinase family protein [Polyangiaceae bacterium]
MLRPSLSSAAATYLRRLPLPALVALPVAALQPACSDDHYHDHHYYGSNGGSGAGGSSSVGGTSGGGTSGTAGEGGAPQPDYPGAPVANAQVGEHDLDIFGVVGNRYWFAVSDEQLETMNAVVGGGPIFDEPLPNGDLYTPDGSEGTTYVDHLWITAAGKAGKTADYGKVQVKLVGQSTLRAWNRRSIPNLNVDVDEFIDEQRIDGFEHLRFNNGQVGSIFRERLVLELYAGLDYPAPLTTFAWVSSNVWGPELSVPYTLVERYKPSFCERWETQLGGGCVNMWEFAGDFAQDPGYPEPIGGGPGLVPSIFDDPNNCQFDACDNTRVKELEQKMLETPEGEGYKAALADWIHWPSFHRFQCLSWVLATGDDALHNQNNVVLVERGDGRFQYLPYSVDISLGQEWYPVVTLPGNNSTSRGCQSDPECWADTIETCEDVIADFAALDPEALLTSVYDELLAEGMLRPGDDRRYEFLRDWFSARLEALPDELESNREPPLTCEYGQVDCGGYCDYPYNCGGGCEPPVGEPAFAPGAGGAAGADGGGEAGGPGECPPISAYSVAR